MIAHKNNMNPLPMEFLTLSIYLTFSFSLFHLTQPLCHNNERSALLQFKETFLINSICLGYPKTASWNLEENSECCSWDGVNCNEDTGFVIKLDLTDSCLKGSINSSSTLFNLVHLQSLDLSRNDFSHSKIPSAVKNLSELSYLDLSDSNLSGQIPSEMLELSRLKSLYLSGSSLQLQNPSLKGVVEKLTNLKKLDLSGVNISSSIPNSLGNLSSLTHLSLRGCQLQGVIPSSLGNLSNLATLEISFNDFLGDLSISIANLAYLQQLSVSSCQFSDQVQSSLSNLTHLKSLDLSYSEISGHNSCSLSWLSWLPKLTKLTDLYFSNSNLVGEIPLWLMNLTQLTYLDMSQNQLTGPIPYWLINLNQLSILDFSSNQLTGQIPSQISSLTELYDLDLSSNRLQGQIPSSISKLKKLHGLKLYSNQLQGQIPSSISKLKNLYKLNLHSNQLQGLIPSSIYELKNLQYLDLRSNYLNDTVELDVFPLKLKNLTVLLLSSNNLSVLTKTNATTKLQKLSSIALGSCNLTEFPKFLQNQDQLHGLDLSSNKISGRIPQWFLNVSVHSLQSLNLSNNLLTGFDHHPILLPWTDLHTLDLLSNELQGSLPLPASSTNHYLVSNNNLTGEIPLLICNLNQLQALDLSNNKLSGVLPQCLGNFSDQLSILVLQSNNFSGRIPQTFMTGSSLHMIDLSHNKLGGKIPRSLVNCKSLEFLNLGYNQITDSFPSWLGILPELKVLILKFNRLHGVMKKRRTDFEFSKLHVIDLSHNMFTGELPSNYFQSWNSMKVVNRSGLSYMQESLLPSEFFIDAYFGFDFSSYAYSLIMNNQGIERKYGKIPTMLKSIILSENQFIGEIPTSISNLKGLMYLNLSNNNLLGHIPSSLGNLMSLESLDLSSNRLSGEIPPQLADLTFLGSFDVSQNHLEGRIPYGKQFDTFESSSFEGNPGLCGKPLSKGCGSSDASSIFAFDWKIVLTGFVSGLIVGVILGNEYFTKIVEWFATNNLGLQLKTAIKRKTRGHRN